MSGVAGKGTRQAFLRSLQEDIKKKDRDDGAKPGEGEKATKTNRNEDEKE